MTSNMTADKYDVFISYARADYKDENNNLIPNNVISKITSAFKKNGISYWIDEDGIYTGDIFAPKIAQAIKNASVFVFVSTENSNASQWVQNEVSVAQWHKKPILPIRCDKSTYADSIIMYLAMLDYCDYHNSPNTAINQLVEAVKEKLPESKDGKGGNSKGDSVYKENILKSLDQIVGISQFAVSRIMESNERNVLHLRELTDSGIKHLCESEEMHFHSLESSIHSHLEEIRHNTTQELREIVTSAHQLRSDLEAYMEEQRKTNKLLEQMTMICSELCHKTTLSEKGQSQDGIIPDISKKRIANLYFVIDVSGSMEGDWITGLNKTMRLFVENFDHSYPISNDAEVHLSVLFYSTGADWQYENPANINGYNWIDLKASGLTNLGCALTELDGDLQRIGTPDIAPLIVFVTDGAPTDSYKEAYSSLCNRPVFLSSKRFCVGLGSAAVNVFEHTSEFRVSDPSKINNALDAIMRIYLDMSGIG